MSVATIAMPTSVTPVHRPRRVRSAAGQAWPPRCDAAGQPCDTTGQPWLSGGA